MVAQALASPSPQLPRCSRDPSSWLLSCQAVSVPVKRVYRREGVFPLYWTIGSYKVKCLQSNVWSALGEGLLSRAEYEGRRAEGH